MHSRRRVLLHGVEALKREFGIDRIDVVLLSHFHDDHVAGVPLLRRLFGTECWVAGELRRPAGAAGGPSLPLRLAGAASPSTGGCRSTGPSPGRNTPSASRRCPAIRAFRRRSCFEADGKRFVHTGDQHFFDRPKFDARRGKLGGRACRTRTRSTGTAPSPTASATAPTSSPTGGRTSSSPATSTRCTPTTRSSACSTWWGEEFERIHREPWSLGDDEAHFEADGWGGWIWPYRVHVAEGEPARVTVTVRNPLPEPATLTRAPRRPGRMGREPSSISTPARGPRSRAR